MAPNSRIQSPMPKIPETHSAEIAALVDELQADYKNASGYQPSKQEHVLLKWRQVARHIISGTCEKADIQHLAVELHLAFIGEGHRTEIINRAKDDPVLLGWRGVAAGVIRRAKPHL